MHAAKQYELIRISVWRSLITLSTLSFSASTFDRFQYTHRANTPKSTVLRLLCTDDARATSCCAHFNSLTRTIAFFSARDHFKTSFILVSLHAVLVLFFLIYTEFSSFFRFVFLLLFLFHYQHSTHFAPNANRFIGLIHIFDILRLNGWSNRVFFFLMNFDEFW